ncbi:UNVERIFIED_CONTAM: hypothetical protein FKN15_054748 [Acipenser sinensis]
MLLLKPVKGLPVLERSSVRYTAELYAALGLVRQQAQALSVAPAHPIAPALELTPPAPVVAPDVTRWHLPYSAGCLAGRMVYHTGLKERGFHIAIRLVHRKYLRFALQGSVLRFLWFQPLLSPRTFQSAWMPS